MNSQTVITKIFNFKIAVHTQERNIAEDGSLGHSIDKKFMFGLRSSKLYYPRLAVIRNRENKQRTSEHCL